MNVGRGQQNIVLILLRDLAEKLSTPMFLADSEGRLVFYNEAAEPLFGRKFSDRYKDELQPESWAELLRAEDIEEGGALTLEQVPPGIAFLERRPAHRRVRITGLDGTTRVVSATAIPLFAGAENFVGMLAIFWEEAE
jgi:PAS domain S-box-containing protein